MHVLFYVLLFIAAITILFYMRASLLVWTAVVAATLISEYLFCPDIGFGFYLTATIVTALFTILNIPPLRRLLFTDRAFAIFKKILPAMSDTEREALEAGTVWWDADLFSGRPDWQKLINYEVSELTEKEQAFIDGPVQKLCAMLDDFEITEALKDLPKSVWDFIKKEKFMGMVVPEEYGGLGFSARAHSEVVQILATRSATAAVTVMVPNSLGPAELLKKYGTDEQKNYYLPRLATGEEIPCFGLTNPSAGSDAASIPDEGVVCKKEINGEEVIGITLNWEKRYITLGPVATVFGIAFQLKDPDKILSDNTFPGITLALIPRDTEGLEAGERHFPLNSGFQVGPNYGHDVFIEIDKIIGGAEYAGKGWAMLMNCLAEGRSISLPALSTGSSKLCSHSAGAYARIRKQFNMPIGRFEGVELKLAEIAANTYMSDAVRVLTATAVDLGEKPSVISAIAKYHLTEMCRTTVNDAMDVVGGAGICLGPKNIFGKVYEALPIGITVEGANILTRSMIIFGQGAIRCHPHVLDEMMAVSENDGAKFDKAFISHIGFVASNKARTIVLGLTCSSVACVKGVSKDVKCYAKHLTRLSSAFAYLADVSMFLIGGSLKRREAVSARLGDILSNLYIASAVIKKYEASDNKAEEKPLMEYSLKTCLYNAQEAFYGVFENYPIPFGGVVGKVLKFYIFPYGRIFKKPSDKDSHKAAGTILTPSNVRNMLTEGVYIPDTNDEQVKLIETTLLKVVAAEKVEMKIKQAVAEGKLEKNSTMDDAMKAGVITDGEKAIVDSANEARLKVIQVDSFPQDFF